MVEAGAPASPEGTLRIAHWLEALAMDPARATTHQAYLLMPAYDTLLDIDADFQPKPRLATGWEQPDPQTYRLTLRDDVTFQDGSKFDAQNVKLNLERDKTVAGAPNANMFEPIDSVTVESPTVAVVHMNRPYPNFLYNMSTIAGAMVSSDAIRGNIDLTSETAGSGGWIWDKTAHQEGAKHVYHANPSYWNKDAVRVENIEFQIITDDAARLNAIQSGQVDLATNIPPDQVVSLAGTNLNVLSDFTITSALEIFDRGGVKVPAFGNSDVRKAVGLLIDRQGFNQSVYGGQGDAAIGGFASPATTWYDAALDARTSNIDEARTLLSDAGYADGFSFDLPSTAVIRSRTAAIAQMLAAGGITANIIDMQSTEYTAAIRKGEVAAGYVSPTSVDIDQWWGRTVSNTGPFNPFKLNDLADLDAEYTRSASMTNPQDRKPILDKLQQAAIDRGVLFPLSQQPRVSIASSALRSTEVPVFAPEDWGPRPQYLWVQK
ncbi:ABC transporter substrate-binding protein [Rhodococcus opacus]|uniref:ABC transporter substrate-binding protein n=1 Tax=Rhodococcus opacus TaxID=37919 RepID=UPI001C470B74|nr:ABC transporter substrate-binding protein [Rhodococcus opacus]